MNKMDLVKVVALKTGLTHSDATGSVDAVLDGVAEALQSGDQVALTGFGTFSVQNRAARKGRNPQTGEALQIPASRSPKFKPGKVLKNAVRDIAQNV